MLPPRLAWGTINATADGRTSAWGFLAACQQQGIVPQRFHSQAFVQSHDPVHVASRGLRYLDSWLHGPGDCLRLFREGMSGAQLGFVTGAWDNPGLTGLTQLLDLPRIVVVDVANHSPCLLPPVDQFDGVWLQGINSLAELAHWEANLAAISKTPIIGWQFRGRLACRSTREPVAGLTGRELLEFANHHWRPTVDWHKLWEVANRRAKITQQLAEPAVRKSIPLEGLGTLRIAIAFDEAFSGYFPETLAALQQAGATLIDFSPLRNDCLPREIDLVYFGDGNLGPHLRTLAENHCLRLRLRAFVQNGGRAIVEGRAAAYFCRTATSSAAGTFPLAGIFPFDASQTDTPHLQRVETKLAEECWLGPAATKIAGYQLPEFRYSDHHEPSVWIDEGVVALPCSIPWHARRDLMRRFFRPLAVQTSSLAETVSVEDSH